MKICRTCGIEKPNEDFYSGFKCKKCSNLETSQYNKLHPEQRLQAQRKYRESRREVLRAKGRIYMKQRCKESPEQVALVRKKSNLKHREARLEKKREYHRTHKAQELAYERKYVDKRRATGRKSYWKNVDESRIKMRIRNQMRRAAKTNTQFALTLEEERALLKTGCMFCGTHEKVTLAHDVPVSEGGMTVRGNVFCLCQSHNSKMWKRKLSDMLVQLPLI